MATRDRHRTSPRCPTARLRTNHPVDAGGAPRSITSNPDVRHSCDLAKRQVIAAVKVSCPLQPSGCAGAVARPRVSLESERSRGHRALLSRRGRRGQGSAVTEERRPRRFAGGDGAYPTDRVLGGGWLEAAPISEMRGRRGLDSDAVLSGDTGGFGKPSRRGVGGRSEVSWCHGARAGLGPNGRDDATSLGGDGGAMVQRHLHQHSGRCVGTGVQVVCCARTLFREEGWVSDSSWVPDVVGARGCDAREGSPVVTPGVVPET